MSWSVRLEKWAIRVGFGMLAMGGGAAFARYSDIGRPAPRITREPPVLASAQRRAPAAARLVPSFPAMPEEPSDLPVDDADWMQDLPTDALGESYRDGLIMTGATPHRLLLFTFDDGPDRRTTPLLLDRLDAAGVRAVFFLTARRMAGDSQAAREQREIARETVRRGHMVASHTFYHRQLPLLEDHEVVSELLDAERIFKRVFGGRPWLFRPPGGARSDRVDRIVAQHGYTTMMWNLGTGDFQVRTAEDVHKTWTRVFERRENEGQRGGIILLHDTHAWSVDAFQLIIQDVMDRNCELLKQGEELYDIVDDPRYFFQARHGGGPSAETRPAELDLALHDARQERLREETLQRCEAASTLAAL